MFAYITDGQRADIIKTIYNQSFSSYRTSTCQSLISNVKCFFKNSVPSAKIRSICFCLIFAQSASCGYMMRTLSVFNHSL